RPLATPPADGVTVVYSTFDALANVRLPNEICPRLSVARGASSNVTRPQADNASTSRATRNGANHLPFFIIDPSRHDRPKRGLPLVSRRRRVSEVITRSVVRPCLTRPVTCLSRIVYVTYVVYVGHPSNSATAPVGSRHILWERGCASADRRGVTREPRNARACSRQPRVQRRAALFVPDVDQLGRGVELQAR